MPKLDIEDRVLETSTTTGTGAYALAGAVAGFRTFGSAVVNGDALQYYAEAVDASGVPTGDWEVGRGVWATGGNLSRLRIFSSSNAGAAVNWAAGTKRIGLTMLSNNFRGLTPGQRLAAQPGNYLGP
jgi:hypothetical protein